ncbi:histidine phosphatase family protein [Chryseomicrobium excrementi]|uniref:Histidine phosphatase family protein n=1 Tax=Chryseomicrobium excrementi TaxID=2041346 RepID=A0A2M9F0G6_9BACL|nr:histidine phosphatase family protein [Chryseomicrobium excrementi]PJK16952.1 histidine phosphatase family protein [Chryseomicrobium excrementi]
MARSTQLFVMRHLPTAGNRNKQYIGWTDEPIVSSDVIPLSNASFQIHTSDLKRTLETAKRYFPNAELVEHDALRELHFGDWEQKTYAELCEDTTYQAWLDNPFEVTATGGESFETFNKRVTEIIEDLLNAASGPLILVVHGGVIRLLKSLWTESNFLEAHATHDTVAHFTLEKQEEWLCTSYSEVPITESARWFATTSHETD